MKTWLKVLLVVLGIVIIIVVTAFFVIDGCTGFIGNVGSDLLH